MEFRLDKIDLLSKSHLQHDLPTSGTKTPDIYSKLPSNVQVQ